MRKAIELEQAATIEELTTEAESQQAQKIMAEAENERLTGERDDWRKQAEFREDVIEEVRAEVDAMTKDRDLWRGERDKLEGQLTRKLVIDQKELSILEEIGPISVICKLTELQDTVAAHAATIERLTETVRCGLIDAALMDEQLTQSQLRVERLTKALAMLYDKYEDGPPCTENGDEHGSPLGNAVRLNWEEEQEILALIPAERDAALSQE